MNWILWSYFEVILPLLQVVICNCSLCRGCIVSSLCIQLKRKADLVLQLKFRIGFQLCFPSFQFALRFRLDCSSVQSYWLLILSFNAFMLSNGDKLVMSAITVYSLFGGSSFVLKLVENLICLVLFMFNIWHWLILFECVCTCSIVSCVCIILILPHWCHLILYTVCLPFQNRPRHFVL